MDHLRAVAARVQRRLRDRPVPPPARAGLAVPEPDRRRGRPARARLQHRGELRHEHELAELRRRVDDEPPHADERARRAELRLGRGRHRGRGRARARDRAPALGDDRQLLGRPDADHDARAASARAADRARHGQPGRRSEPERKRRRRHGREREPVALARAGRQPGSDQGARHERRWPRERQLRAPVREPDGLHEPAPAVGDPGHPLRARPRVRKARRRPPAGLRALRGDVRALDRLGRLRHLLRSRRQPESRGARRERRCREHGGQGGALRRARVRAVRRDDDRDVDRRGDLGPRQLHAARRRGPAREHDARRGLAGRGRRRPLRNPDLRPARGLHRRADGRPDARVPRQEDPGDRDEARRPLSAGRADADPGLRVHLGAARPGEGVDPQSGAARALRGRSTRSPPPRTTTARPSAA